MSRASDGVRTWQLGVRMSEEEVAATWQEYRRTRSDTLRNTLMEHYLPLVKYNSERLAARLPDEVQLDDLISAGCDGLRDAIEMFDLDRGVKFETYCAARIRGAILDALRTADWVPRLVRHRASQLAQSRHKLEGKLGRKPTNHELANFMGLSEEECEKLVREANAVGMFSIDRHFQESDSGRDTRESDLLANARAENPLRQLQEEDLKGLITKGLSKNERLILILYYYQEMTMKEIGATLRLSESRVSQMHTDIIKRLQAILSGREDDFLATTA